MALKVPPRYANIEMAALLSEISDGAFREYARLRAISWGKDVVEFWLSEYQAIFGISEPTLYRRLSELRKNAGLRFSSTRNAITGDRLFQVSFSILRTENALLTTTPELTDSLELGEGVNAVLNSENRECVLKNENSAKNQEPEADFPFRTRILTPPAPVPVDPIAAACLNLYCKVTGFPAYPGSIQPEKVEPVLRHYLEQAGNDLEVASAALEPFWSAWRAGKRQNGRSYSQTSAAWLTDWALSGVIPESAEEKTNANDSERFGKVDPSAYSAADLEAARNIRSREFSNVPSVQ